MKQALRSCILVLVSSLCWLHPVHAADPQFRTIEMGAGSGSSSAVVLSDEPNKYAQWRELLRYAHYCRLVAQSDAEILKQFPTAYISETKHTKVKFFVVKDDEKREQLIVVRGSSNITNWIVDFMFWKVKDMWLDIKLHKGFYEASREVFWDGVFNINPEYKTKITGHSLGGSIALILGLYLQDFGHNNLEVVSFGQPRITNRSGANKFGDYDYRRVAISKDIVPHLPPWFFAYRHFGKHVKLVPNEQDLSSQDTESEFEDPDPEEVKALWKEMIKNQNPEESPALPMPSLAKVWMGIRPDASPSDMGSLFESSQWKYMQDLYSQLNGQDAPSQEGEKERSFYSNQAMTILNGEGEELQGSIGKWHKIDLYIDHIEDFLESQGELLPAE